MANTQKTMMQRAGGVTTPNETREIKRAMKQQKAMEAIFQKAGKILSPTELKTLRREYDRSNRNQ